jgi:hypothetical protein
MSKAGAFPVDIVQYDFKQQVVRTETTGVVVSYPSEYREFGINETSLATLAATTGGRVVTSPADSYSRQGLDFVGTDNIPLWYILLLLAAILFPLDVAIRRLRIDPLDLTARGVRGARDRLSALRRRPSEAGAT